MSEPVTSTIRSVEGVPVARAVASPPMPNPPLLGSEPEPSVLQTLPWAWIAAALALWALLLALAAWWVGGGTVTPRQMWVWVLVWAVPGLAVSALLVRLAVGASERERAALRLRAAADDISALERRLAHSSRSFGEATESLADATRFLLEQVDTSRDDLRNQIGSATALADALRRQTEALAAIRGADGPRPEREKPEPEGEEPALRRAPPDTASFSGTAGASGPFTAALGTTVTSSDSPASTTAAPAPDAAGWKWSEMLRQVDPEDAAPDAEADTATALRVLDEERLNARAVVDDGAAYDAATLWGEGDVGGEMERRFADMATLLAARLNANPDELAAARRLAARFQGEPPTTIEARVSAFQSEEGRAALLLMAALERVPQ